MSDILVIGSLAYDTISTPEGHVDRTLGGSANYFSLAASLYARVRMVGVVGEDYEERHVEMLTRRGVDIQGMRRVEGLTFHWEGEYKGDMNEAITKATHLNVFQHFNPEIPVPHRDTKYVFLANIDPDLQLNVLEQVNNPVFVGMDTMNFWITSKLAALKKVLSRVDALLINEGESKLLTGKANAIGAAKEIVKMGPNAVIIKRGEYGFLLYTKDKFFILPAYPVERVVDPTGAGDTFAGGVFGYLAHSGQGLEEEALRRACIHGCMTASFTVQDFGVAGIESADRKKVDERYGQFRRVVAYPI